MDTRRNLTRDHSNSEWSLSDIQDAILREIRILETGLHTNSQPVQNPLTPTASFHMAAHQGARPTPNSLEVKKKRSCIYCSRPHIPSLCKAVTDPQKWLDIVKQERLCFNCLAHHKISQLTRNIVAVIVNTNTTPAFAPLRQTMITRSHRILKYLQPSLPLVKH